MSHLGRILFTISALIIIRGYIKAAEITVGQNSQEFNILCRIYKQAVAAPSVLNVEEQIGKIVADIDQINVSLSDDSWFTQLGGQEEKKESGETKQGHVGNGNEEERRVGSAIRALQQSKTITKLPSSSRSVQLASSRMQKIEEKVGVVTQELRARQIDERFGDVSRLFNKAIFGDGTDKIVENDPATYKTGGDRVATCGKARLGSKGDKAGSSLIMDFLCLCGYLETEGLDKVCGPHVALGTVYWKPSAGDAAGSKGKESWEQIRDACKKSPGPTEASSPMGWAALTAFAEAIAYDKQITNSGKPGLFGKNSGGNSAPSAGCDGDRDSNTGGNNAICVYYGSGNPDDISWYATMKLGLEKLGQLEKENSTLYASISTLQMLRNRAEELYEEARTTIDIEKAILQKNSQNQTSKQNLGAPTDKATAQDGASVNRATGQRFILPWTLFI